VQLPDHVRGKLYAILPLVGALIVYYRLADKESVDLWVGLVLALLGGGNVLAAFYTPQIKDRPAAPTLAARSVTLPEARLPDDFTPPHSSLITPAPPSVSALSAAVDLANQLGDLARADAKTASITLPDGRVVRMQLSVTPERP
jgi:hypothetical protein